MCSPAPKIAVLALIVSGLFCGCISFSPYDSAAADDIRELMRRTNEVVTDSDRGRLSLAESRQFLRQSQARLEVLRTRKSGMSGQARSALAALDAEYQKLLAENRPLRRRETADLRRLIFALQDLRPAPSVFRHEYAAAPPADDTSTNDTCVKKDDEKKKHCPDKNKRDDDSDCRKHR